MLFKQIEGDIVRILGGSRPNPGPRPRLLTLNQAVLPGTTITL